MASPLSLHPALTDFVESDHGNGFAHELLRNYWISSPSWLQWYAQMLEYGLLFADMTLRTLPQRRCAPLRSVSDVLSVAAADSALPCRSHRSSWSLQHQRFPGWCVHLSRRALTLPCSRVSFQASPPRPPSIALLCVAAGLQWAQSSGEREFTSRLVQVGP